MFPDKNISVAEQEAYNKRLIRMGQKPKEIVNPVLKPENTVFRNIFIGLRGCRRFDKGQTIPTIDIVNLCSYYGMSKTQIEEAIYIMRHLDIFEIERENKRKKEEFENVNR